MLQAIGTSRFALYHHVVRRRVEPQLEAEFPDPFSAEVDANWRRRLESKRLFTNDLYIAIIRRPRQGRGGIADRLARLFGRVSQDSWTANFADERRELDAARDALLAALSQYGARALGTYETAQAACAPNCSNIFRRCTMPSFARCSCPKATSAIICPIAGSASARRPPSCRRRATSSAASSAWSRSRNIPARPRPGTLDDLLRLPHEMVVTQSFGFVDRQAALGRVNLTLRRMRAADDEALSLRGELAVARDDLAAGRAAFGEHHLTVAVRGGSLKAVDDGVAEVSAALADRGMIAVREEMALEPAFWAQFPGNFQYIPRRGMIASRNFASLASLHNFARGKARRQSLGAGGDGARDHRRGALSFQLPPRRPRQFHGHRPVGVGQDGGAQFPARPGAQI